MIALLAPGQGAQKPGMLAPWLERPGARERLAAFSEAAGLDLEHLGTEADAEAIADTAVTQPLLVASALLSGEALLAELGGTLGSATPSRRTPPSPGTPSASSPPPRSRAC